jgi:hypothetical protein
MRRLALNWSSTGHWLATTGLQLLLPQLRLVRVSRPVCLGVGPPIWGPWPDFYYCRTSAVFMLWDPSPTRGRVCNLLLQFAVTLGYKFRRIHDHILLSHLRLPQSGGPGSHIFAPQGQGGPVIPPGYWVPFSSPLTTRRATVEVF